VPADQIVHVLLPLERQPPATVRTLAVSLEGSERTGQRNTVAVAIAGRALYTERGAKEGVRLSKGCRANLTSLSSPELKAPKLAGHIQALRELSWEGAAVGGWTRRPKDPARTHDGPREPVQPPDTATTPGGARRVRMPDRPSGFHTRYLVRSRPRTASVDQHLIGAAGVP